jgi:hypothetical protein
MPQPAQSPSQTRVQRSQGSTASEDHTISGRSRRPHLIVPVLAAGAAIATLPVTHRMHNGPGTMGFGLAAFVGPWTSVTAAMILPPPAPSPPYSPFAATPFGPILASAQPQRGTQTRSLDRGRPRLREPPRRHAGPLPGSRPRLRPRRGIANVLSIGIPQVPSRRHVRPAARVRGEPLRNKEHNNATRNSATAICWPSLRGPAPSATGSRCACGRASTAAELLYEVERLGACLSVELCQHLEALVECAPGRCPVAAREQGPD